MNLELNVIKSYDDMLYESRPVSFNEFINDKYNNVHNELYNDALSKYFDDIIDKTITSKFVYEFYKSLKNNSNSFEEYYSYYESLDKNSYIKKTLLDLGINQKTYLELIYNITCITLDTAKNYIKEKDIIKGISNISDINDFRVLYFNNVTYIETENEHENPYGEEFEVYKIIKDNSDINIYLEKTVKVFESELKDFVFILEEENGTRIGYNINGEWLLILDDEDSFKNFNDLIDDIRNNNRTDDFNEYFYDKIISNTTLNNYLSSMKINIKNYLLERSYDLISQYKDLALIEYKAHHKVIEIKNSEYWMPSSVCITSNVKPYKKEIKSLEKYWNMNQSMNDISIYDIKNTNENILDSELYEINYITGIAKIRSRSAGLEYETQFKYLNGDINVSEDMTLNKTFTAELKNI